MAWSIADRCNNSLAVSHGKLMTHLREAQERPDWLSERERRSQIRSRMEALRPGKRCSLVSRGAAAGVPDTIQWAPGSLMIPCRDREHWVEPLVVLAKALDPDDETMPWQVESTPARKPVDREHAVRSDW